MEAQIDTAMAITTQRGNPNISGVDLSDQYQGIPITTNTKYTAQTQYVRFIMKTEKLFILVFLLDLDTQANRECLLLHQTQPFYLPGFLCAHRV